MVKDFPFRCAPAALLAVSLAACGGTDEGESAAALPATDPNISTESPRASLSEIDFGDLDPAEIGLTLNWSHNTVSRDHDQGKGPARLTDVSTRRSDGYDRIVFTFRPHIPGYRIAVAEGGGCDGTEAASGSPVQLAVDLELAQATEDGQSLVRDRNRALDFPALVTATQVCDEDHRVRWLLGMSSQSEFRVLEMRGEPRLVVDLLHPSP